MPWLAGAAHGTPTGEPLDRRPTDWRLADWARLSAGERRWASVGFSLGWHGTGDGERPAPPPGEAALADWRAALARATAGLAPDARLAPRLVHAQRRDPLPRFALSGDDWMALAVRHRLALLHGVYLGAYARAIDERVGPGADQAALEAAFADARRLVRPRLALAPPVALARLSDWYFYTDRRAAPLVEAIAAIAAQIKGP